MLGEQILPVRLYFVFFFLAFLCLPDMARNLRLFSWHVCFGWPLRSPLPLPERFFGTAVRASSSACLPETAACTCHLSPPLSRYCRLEARLPMSPITPNEALKLLTCAFPMVHHRGVVEHLVRVVRGNSCCLDPQLCLALMAQLLFPAPPRSFYSFTSLDQIDEEVALIDRERNSWNAPCLLDDAAVRVALAPLHETLLQSVAVHLQWHLQGTTGSPSEEYAGAALRLWDLTSSDSASATTRGEAKESDASESMLLLLLERGASLLLAFSVQISSPYRQRCLADAERSSHAALPQCADCTALACRVIGRLFEQRRRTSSTRQATPVRLRTRHSEHFHACPKHAHHPREGREGLQWREFCEAACRCWQWSIFVCRATPLLPSRAVRAFVVDSLIESLQTLQKLLPSPADSSSARAPVQRAAVTAWSRQRRLAVVEMLHWLLTRSLPPLHVPIEVDAPASAEQRSPFEKDGSDATHQSARPPQQSSLWTVELRHVLLKLASSFADASIALLTKTESLSSNAENSLVGEFPLLIDMMAAVALRLSLQFTAAAAPSCDACAALSEVDVARRLLQCVLSLPLRIGRVPLTEFPVVRVTRDETEATQPLLSASEEDKGSDVCGVAMSEETWCRLACVQRCVSHLTTPAKRVRSAGAAVSPFTDTHVKDTTAYLTQLLRIGFCHIVQFCRSTKTCSAGEKDSRISNSSSDTQRCPATDVEQQPAAVTTAAPEKRFFSLTFLLTFVKCWRAWLDVCPNVSHADWLTCAHGGERHVHCTDCAPLSPDNTYLNRGSSTPPAHNELSLTERNDAVRRSALLTSQGLLASVHQLSLWLVEAWAAALTAIYDLDPLDVCACWSMLFTSSRLHRRVSGSRPFCFAAQHTAVCACEQRFSRQCEKYLKQLRNARFERGVGAMLKACEARPRLNHASLPHRAQASVDGADEFAVNRWRPVYAPVFISHTALRLLNDIGASLDAAAAAATATNAEERALGSDGAPQLPLSETSVEVLRRTIESPLPMELTYFQLWMVAAYVDWCEAAMLHSGWCRLNAEDCQMDSRDGQLDDEVSATAAAALKRRGSSAPWLILAVEGVASSCGADTATLVYLWSLCDRESFKPPAAYDHADECSLLCMYNRSLCAVSPLAFSAPPAPHQPVQSSTCSLPYFGSGPVKAWLRRAVDVWQRRYALRLLLFFLHEESWQRHRKTSAGHPISALPSCFKNRSGALQVASAAVNAGQQRAAPNRMSLTDSFAMRPVLTVARDDSSFLWHSDALHPLLCWAARRLVRRVAWLTTKVLNSRTPSHPGAPCTHDRVCLEVSRLLSRWDGRTQTGRAKPSCGTCVRSLLASVCESHAFPQSSIGLSVFRCPSGPPSRYSCQRLSRTLSDHVWELEDKLQSLGLVAAGTAVFCRESNCAVKHLSANGAGECAAAAADVNSATTEEARALLTALCASPELTFLTSPCTLRFVDELWHTCWAWLVHMSDGAHVDSTTPRTWSESGEASKGMNLMDATGEAAEVDALVTCRVMLHATRHLHLLAAELLEYVCSVHIPALKASATGPWSFVASPAEALERQLAVRDAAAAADGPAVQDRCEFRFSAISLRTYEVLCLDRFGPEERRRPCVWQRWMQELAREDAVLLQQHHLIHPRSRVMTAQST